MSFTKALFALSLCICLSFMLTGCALLDNVGSGAGKLNSNLTDGYKESKQNAPGWDGLTNAAKLIGAKEKGTDSFTGSYTAEYRGFDGKEILFGGMSDSDSQGYEVTYTLVIASGKATLYIDSSDGQTVIADSDHSGTYEFSAKVPNHYIILQGDEFSGSLTITVQQGWTTK